MATASAESHPFQAEVTEVLSLVVNSLYSHKEIFLREIVSNASDALGKLRIRSLTEPDLARGDTEPEIRIRADREAGTLTIEDTGIGMTRVTPEQTPGDLGLKDGDMIDVMAT